MVYVFQNRLFKHSICEYARIQSHNEKQQQNTYIATDLNKPKKVPSKLNKTEKSFGLHERAAQPSDT